MRVLFRWLLNLYPLSFFREFSQEMTLCFDLGMHDVRHQNWKRRSAFFVREFWGAFTGAISEQLGCRFEDFCRRFTMTSFRFSRISMAFMILALIGVLMAIETPLRHISPDLVQQPLSFALRLAGIFLFLMAIFGAIGYGVLRVINRSAADRLVNIDTWPQERQSPRK